MRLEEGVEERGAEQRTEVGETPCSRCVAVSHRVCVQELAEVPAELLLVALVIVDLERVGILQSIVLLLLQLHEPK